MKKTIFSILFLMIAIYFTSACEVKAATATVPLSVTINGSLVITDASMDTSAGKDPTLNVTLNVTPDLSASDVTGTANFRIRSNYAMWTLSASKPSFTAGGTGLAETDVLLDVAKVAGSSANASAGAIQSPFTSQTDISSIMTTATTVIAGTAITSASRDATNANNYFEVDTTYTVHPDFFFTPGTATSTITYTLTNP